MAALRPELAADLSRAMLTTWNDDPWAGESYSASTVTVADGDDELIATPLGRVHFAGEHTAGAWAGPDGRRTAFRRARRGRGPRACPSPEQRGDHAGAARCGAGHRPAGLAAARHALAARRRDAVVFRVRAARVRRAAVGDPRRQRQPGSRAGHRGHDGLHRAGPAVDAPPAGRPGVALDAGARIRAARAARARAPGHRPALGGHGARRAARARVRRHHGVRGDRRRRLRRSHAAAAEPSAPSGCRAPRLSSSSSRSRPGSPSESASGSSSCSPSSRRWPYRWPGRSRGSRATATAPAPMSPDATRRRCAARCVTRWPGRSRRWS